MNVTKRAQNVRTENNKTVFEFSTFASKLWD